MAHPKRYLASAAHARSVRWPAHQATQPDEQQSDNEEIIELGSMPAQRNLKIHLNISDTSEDDGV